MNHPFDSELEETRVASLRAAPRPGRARKALAIVASAAAAALMTMGAELVGSATQARAATGAQAVAGPDGEKSFRRRDDARLTKAEGERASRPLPDSAAGRGYSASPRDGNAFRAAVE